MGRYSVYLSVIEFYAFTDFKNLLGIFYVSIVAKEFEESG
jgi:hypothetical protein